HRNRSVPDGVRSSSIPFLEKIAPLKHRNTAYPCRSALANAVSPLPRISRRHHLHVSSLGRNIGSEEEKMRPCLIIQNDTGNLKSSNTIIAPITNSEGTRAVTVPISGIYKYTEEGQEKQLSGYILLGNITTVSKSRLENCIAQLKAEMSEVDKKIMTSLGIFKLYKDLLDKNDRDKRRIKQLLHEVYQLREELSKNRQGHAEQGKSG